MTLRNLLERCGPWLVLFIVLAPLAAWAGDPRLVPRSGPGLRQADELLVSYAAGSVQALGLDARDPLAKLGIARVRRSPGQTMSAQALDLRRDRAVQWVQPNAWRYALAQEVVPNDPYYLPQRNERRYQQWHLPRVNANFAWSVTEGSDSWVAAVVDTGIDLNHPDLKNQLIPGTSIVNQEKYQAPAGGQDDNGHGTHVAGLIAAATDNGVGVAGTAWFGKLMPVKVLNNNGEGTDADVAAGIVTAVDRGCRLINLSLGGPSENDVPPAALQAAIDYAYTRGVLVVAAAGNSGDHTRIFPAALPHVLAVAATDPFDARSSYSTTGAYVALAAPGGSGAEAFNQTTGILSTYWNTNSTSTDLLGGPEAGEYAVTAGTSMAAGLVTGAALLVWAHDPALSPDGVADTLKATAVDIGAPGPDEETGSGRIDLLAALGNPAVPRPALTLYNFPNPFDPERESTQIVFLLDAPTDVTVRIYDTARDLVWERTYGRAETVAGKNLKPWDGRNGVGERVANGAYLVRATTADGQASRTKVIAVLRQI